MLTILKKDMKYLFYFLFFSSTILSSQNEYKKSVDSLYKLLNTTDNIDLKIDHYNKLCSIYSKYDFNEFEKCNVLLLSIAKKSNSPKGLSFFYKNKAMIADINGNKKQAIFYATKADSLFFKRKDWNNYFLNSFQLGGYLMIDEQYVKSYVFLKQSLQYALNLKSKHIFMIYSQLANLSITESDYFTALEYANKALACLKSTDDKTNIYYTISSIYKQLKKYDNSLDYIELSILESKSELNDTILLIHKASVFYEMNRFNEALSIALNCEKYFKKYNLSPYLPEVNFLIAKCYTKKGGYKLANIYIENSLKSSSLLETSIIIDFYIQKTVIYLTTNDKIKAKKAIDYALELLKEDQYFELKLEVYNQKVEIEKKLGNYKTAFYYQEKKMFLEQTNYKNSYKNKIHQLEVNFGFTEKNDRIKNLQIQKLKKQVEVNTKNNYLNYSIIGLITLVLLVLYFIRNQKVIQHKNKLIGIANTKLTNEKDRTQKSLVEKETLLKEIHHRVKNNMQLVISLLKIQSRNINELSIENFIEVSENRIRSMALIHEYLYESENINYVNFEEYIKRLTRSLLSSFSGQGNIQIETEIENAHFDIETSIPLGLIINELVINAFKHAFFGKEQGEIKIKLFLREGLHHLIVSDNGIGFIANTQKGTSIGLKIVKLLVSQINGVMDIKNDSGTHFIIQFNNNNNTNE